MYNSVVQYSWHSRICTLYNTKINGYWPWPVFEYTVHCTVYTTYVQYKIGNKIKTRKTAQINLLFEANRKLRVQEVSTDSNCY